ncbi:DUF4294 domain-containing protein [Arachidicoccus soli]|uniref:DUF4294 domain-containing protein n=1 Tax=Arachidicoccus soli TaxID=2341117 RepID=A0A386HS15_9BACT|nr:DUF4294 domain-containing protein [Arachidicoccus soli]
MCTYRKIFRLFAIISFLLFNRCLRAQTIRLGPNDTIRVELTITDDGFKVPTSELTPLYLFTRMNAKWRRYYEAWNRLKNAVYVTYPYAKAASRIIQEINGELVGVTNRRKRKAIIKAHEKDLRQQFTSKLRNLSVYQGKVLMKLICRETGNNCYEILDEYKGDFNAVLYQGVARLFGSSLKQTYDPNGEDQSIEILTRQAAMYYGY